MSLFKAILVIPATYFRINTLKRFRMKVLRPILLLLIIISGVNSLCGQGCADAANNQMCADALQPTDTLSASPFSYSCFSATETFFYSFQTNSIADVGSIQVDINNYDCDDILGNDSIQILVVAVPAGADPCDPASYVSPLCFGDSAASFSIDLSSLANNQEYLLIAGSNHDSANYGPCAFDVNISGSAVDIQAGVEGGQILASLGETVQLTVAGADTTLSINWTPPQFLDDPSSTSPSATPEQTTSFEVTGTVGGCLLTDIVTITVSDPVQIYNTFTPNGDGMNDTWRIKYIERFPNCQLEVFDRWGQSIFKSVGYAQPWDGTYKGNYLPTAAYFYVLELNSLLVTIPPITGTISIVH